MRNTFFLTAFILISQTNLFAQSPASFANTQQVLADASHTISLLEQNAFIVMVGVLVLLGIAWLGYVFSACAELNEKKQPTHRNALGMLLVMVGLSAFCSSCSTEQQMRAIEITETQKGEHSYCVCPSRHNHSQYFNTSLNGAYFNNGYANWRDTPHCRQCGQRVNPSNRW